MKDFFYNLSSLYWWISVVIVGILINLGSAYLKSRLDASLSKTSTWWRQRSELQKAQRQALLDKVRGDTNEQTQLSFRQLKSLVSSVWALALSTFFLVFMISINLGPTDDVLWWPFNQAQVSQLIKILKVLSMACGSLCMIMSLMYANESNYLSRLLKEARTKIKIEGQETQSDNEAHTST